MLQTKISLAWLVGAYVIVTAWAVGAGGEWHKWSCPNDNHAAFSLATAATWPIAVVAQMLGADPTGTKCFSGEPIRRRN